MIRRLANTQEINGKKVKHLINSTKLDEMFEENILVDHDFGTVTFRMDKKQIDARDIIALGLRMLEPCKENLDARNSIMKQIKNIKVSP